MKVEDPSTFKMVTSKKTKKAAAEKPDGPKRPKSAFFCYQDVRRAQIKAANPDLNNKEIVRQMAAEYKELTDAQKEPYTRQAEIEK